VLHFQVGELLKKPLHAKNDQFLISSKGRLIGWGKADVKNLIKKANQAMSENLQSKEKINYAEAERMITLEWLDMIVKSGFSKKVVKQLNSRIAHVNYHHILMHSSDGHPYWRYVANGDQIDDPQIGVAYGISHLLASGALDRLRRCKSKDCQSFFLGRPNAKWCSTSCGSKFRVYEKRKNDRKRKQTF
jgi:predicted RNA-binding Zn ribbon-like protein